MACARVRNAPRNVAWQGMNWIRPVKRLAIYLRDGLACAWCGTGLETGAVLTLDHLTPCDRGGSNDTTNLVTACKHCNDSRGKRSTRMFANAVAGYLDAGTTADDILAHVRRTSRRSLAPYMQQARDAFEQRGNFTKALADLANRR